MSEVDIELTVLTKAHGILSKRIRLDGDKIHSDGSECKMGTGRAERRPIANIQDLAALIESLEPRQAITLGRMRPGLGNTVAIVSKNKLNGASLAVARAAENFIFEPGCPAWILLDHDTKGMPEGVRNKLTTAGGFWPAIVGVCPGLAAVERLSRNSTSTGLRRIDTGEQFAGSGGLHVYPLIKDGTDFRRFLKSLNDRCWLAGLGWIALSNAGSYLDRSIIDITVAGPERLVFEGAPIVEAPLEQDQELRRPVITPGIAIDSLSVCPPLRASEMAEVRRLKTNAKQALAGERNKILNERAAHLAQQQKIPIEAARRIVDNECRGLLLSSRVLEFDDPDLIKKTVADVLDNPSAFENQTLADPLDGAEGGHNKAMVMIGTDDGIPFIHSFAHHGVNYQLRFDAAAVEERIGTEDVLETFISLVLRAELSALELSDLIDVVVRRTNRRPKLIKDAVKEALRDQAVRRREAARLRMQAEQNDSRPELPRPPIDAPLTEEMAKINSILSEAPLDQRLCRDMDGHAVKPRRRPVPNTHAFSIDKEEDVPEQWMIVRLSEYGVTEEIERFINYVDENGRPVVPPRELVKAYMCRDDRVLHVLSAIAVLPIVLADGTILGCNKGFDPTRGIYFMVPEAIMALVPRPEDCTPEAVGKAMQFLTDDWLVDVKTSYVGKCVAISQTLTLIERSLLPDRPVYLYNAGRRGSGKTTLIKMTVAAATGHQAASSAWTMKEEERRKAILANFMAGVAYILWDNIPRGLQITCPHIERSCSFSYYADRKLGVSEMVATAATSIHVFTGNNIGARGELASRCLTCKLEADRPDPENREFTHPDPIDWTLKNRDEILRALFTILLGNPVLRRSPKAAMKTRFKTWWRLVGSAVENAATQARTAEQNAAEVVEFEKLFLSQQDDDEDDVTWAELLVRMARQWSETKTLESKQVVEVKPFESKQVAEVINTHQSQLQILLREFLFEGEPASEKVSAKAVGKRLSRHVGNVVRFEERAVVLRTKASIQGKGAKGYFVEFLDGQPPPEEDM